VISIWVFLAVLLYSCYTAQYLFEDDLSKLQFQSGKFVLDLRERSNDSFTP
jgi:hypothetical protein